MDDRHYETWRQRIEDLIARRGHAAALDEVRAVRLDDADPRLQLREGILLTQLGRWSDAVEALEPLASVRDTLGMPEEVLWLLATVQALANAGRPADALPLAREAAAHEAVARHGRLLLAQVHRMLGDEAAEEELLRPAGDGGDGGDGGHGGDDPTLLAAEAVRLWRADRRDDAEALARRAVELDGDRPDALGLLGLAALGRGELATARGHLGRAMALQPGESAWAHGAAEAVARQGDLDGAIAILRHALEHHPEGIGRTQLLESLAALTAESGGGRGPAEA
jgi:tetratricopeptide (TPR) repeat protein